MSWRTFVVVFLLPAVALAQQPSPDPDKSPPVEAIPPGDDNITPLRKGQLAPYDGQLYDPLTALRWANWLQQYKYRLVWDVQKEKRLCEAETTYREDLLKVEKDRAQKVEDDLVKRLERSEQSRLEAEEEARNPAWYSTRTFGIVVGVVATAVVFGVAVAAVNATRSAP